MISVTPGFATDTASKTGLSDRTIRHEVQIGSMPEAVREAAAARADVSPATAAYFVKFVSFVPPE